MDISYSAVLMRYICIALFLVFWPVVSAHANPARKVDIYKMQRQDPVKSKKPEIKEVPKSRKQIKPAIVKPKVKPIKIVRPKIKKH
ncbi:MAG: hypothetical protein V4594_01655 [Bacteroidota bacterium]